MELLVFIIFGVITAVLAKSRGRNIFGWFLIGGFTCIIGLIILLVLPDLLEQEAKEMATEEKIRRLKEKVKKEKIISEQKSLELASRIDVHDKINGIDTSSPNQRLSQGPTGNLSQNNKINSSSMKKCPRCAEEVKSEAKICRFCQHTFVDSDGYLKNDQGDSIKNCPQCAEEIKADAKMCHFCKSEFV